jgi:hypothetical protein
MTHYQPLIQLGGRQVPVSNLQIKFNPRAPSFDQFTVLVTVELDGQLHEVELDARGEPMVAPAPR